MAKKADARRYAQAVFEIAQEKKELDRWQADLQKIVAAISDATFLAALDSPKIKVEDKARFLRERLGKINPLALNLAYLLITKSSIGIIKEIAAEYLRLLDSYRGVETAEVTTAVPLDTEEQKELAARLGVLVGAKVEMKTKVDPEILGGVIARAGGKLLDGSTRSKLEALKKELGGKN
ncbi:MAG: ATP synthase F1 subunit delta [Dehalococcoidales bacterium]|jgi:F-type H+-transporting ATPase subunit delta